MGQELLTAENLTKSYGEKLLFENLNFSISQGDKIALIAHNGVGKSTLLNILMGDEIPESGEITKKNMLKIAYLKQNPQFPSGAIVKEVLFHLDNLYIEAINNYHLQLKNYEKDASQKNLNLLDQATSLMDQKQAWDYENQITELLQRLSITNLQQAVEELSGGQKKKLALASIIIDQADLIILDEPTNHLDIETIEWLEQHISNSKQSLLMVTHDRYFLDAVCDKIVEIDQHTSFTYKGNYSYFIEKKAEREA